MIARMYLTDIDAVWYRIETVAKAILDDDGTSAEDLKRECREQRALCFSTLDGVCIVTLAPNREAEDLDLFIWLAVSTGPHGAYEAHLPEIEQVARDLGAARMRFRTKRRGWLKKLDSSWTMTEEGNEMEFVRGIA